MEKNSAYVAKMDKQLKQWDADVDALAAQGEKASDAARTTYQEYVKGMRASRDAAQHTFQEMRVASQEAGEKMQAKMTAAWESMQKALEKAASDMKK